MPLRPTSRSFGDRIGSPPPEISHLLTFNFGPAPGAFPLWKLTPPGVQHNTLYSVSTALMAFARLAATMWFEHAPEIVGAWWCNFNVWFHSEAHCLPVADLAAVVERRISALYQPHIPDGDDAPTAAERWTTVWAFEPRADVAQRERLDRLKWAACRAQLQGQRPVPPPRGPPEKKKPKLAYPPKDIEGGTPPCWNWIDQADPLAKTCGLAKCRFPHEWPPASTETARAAFRTQVKAFLKETKARKAKP